MRITLSNTPIYCLTCEDEGGSKRKHMEDIANPEFITPNIGIPKNKSGATGFFRMVEKGLKSQVCREPFRPFLMLEDDISFSFDKPQMYVDIPDDADLLYVGLSNCSMNDYMFHYSNYYESIEGFPDIVRIKHMLSTHGIMVCSALGASVIQRTMLEVFLSDKAWDIPLAYIQPFYNVYAVRIPWVYQDANYGGDEACTLIVLNGQDKKLPEEWISKDFTTIKML